MMDKNKRRMGLGKGLGALLAERSEPENNEKSIDIGLEESNEIPIDLIDTNPFQPRTNFDPTSLNELKESIQVQGIIQPITVRKTGENKFQLISGERRLQASKLAGLSKIPAYVKEVSDTQMLEMGLIENIQRENLNPMEIALAYQRLISECNLKHEELGQRVGKDRSTVNNYLRLINLPEIIQNGLKEKKLSMGHARAMLGLKEESFLEKLYLETINNDLSVRKVEEKVKELNNLQPSTKTKKGISKTKIILTELQDKLNLFFGKKVAVVSDNNAKGEIKISFNSKMELEEIINKLKK
jgi:ParB family chromosome partitioning protein